MNNKEFFKEVLKPQMPDFEKVKEEILEKAPEPAKKESKVFTLNFAVKRLVPAVACIAIVAISVFSAIYSENSDSVKILQNGGFKSEVSFNGEESTSTSTNKANLYKAEQKASEKETQTENTEVSESTTAYFTDNFFLNKDITQKSSFSFSSFYELQAFAISLKSENDKLLYEYNQQEYEFLQSAESIEMILKENAIYSVFIDSERLNCNGAVKKMSGNSLVCCVFYAMDNDNEYNIHYSLSKQSSTSDGEKYRSQSGYEYSVNGNTFTTNIDGYLFYITTTASEEEAKEYIDKIDFTKEIYDKKG